MVEHYTENVGVGGSSPPLGTTQLQVSHGLDITHEGTSCDERRPQRARPVAGPPSLIRTCRIWIVITYVYDGEGALLSATQ